MNLQTLKRAEEIKVCIDSTAKNIEHLEKIKACNEIMVVACTSKAIKAIKGVYCDDKDNLAPMYFTGEEKNKMLNIALKRDKEFRDKHIEELHKL
jgi:hypothetical protein